MFLEFFRGLLTTAFQLQYPDIPLGGRDDKGDLSTVKFENGLSVPNAWWHNVL